MKTCVLNFAWLLSCALTAAAPSEQRLPRAKWGAALIDVRREGSLWTIAGKKQTVTVNATNLAIEIQAGKQRWTLVGSSQGDLFVGSPESEVSLRLADAAKCEIAPYDTGYKTGLKLSLAGWPARSLKLYLTVCLEGPDEELVFDVVADESTVAVRRLHWPAPVDSGCFDSTVLCNGRGVLLPRDWPKAYHPIRGTNPDGLSIKTNDTSETQSNVIEDWSMSWWGFQKASSAMMVLVETPDDAAYQFSHPPGGPTLIGPRWRASLGKLRYLRTLRMCFFPNGNYVDMAKRYRRYAMETGLFVSLKEKISRQPLVRELIGTPLVRAGILTNYKSDSDRARRTADPNERYRLTTFDERAAFLRRLKTAGVDRLVVVLTGWPRLGYDRQHPDVLPPVPEAGGWEGMKRLAEACRELGYIFSLHDQYRDYYVDAPSYDPQFAIHEESAATPPQAFPGTRFGDWKEGLIPFMDHWDGGKMSYLNGRFMLGHLMKNYQGLYQHGIRPQGTYLDVFGYVPPDEDFNPEHPTTRSDCLRERMRCYNWSRANLGFVGTEAACDWTVPYVDISSPLSQTKGIPIPLFNLVYHEAIITTYRPDDLRGFLNGGLPQMSARDPDENDLARIRRMSALHKRLATVELIRHELLDKNRERSIFADGTSVTVDWETKTADIQPALP